MRQIGRAAGWEGQVVVLPKERTPARLLWGKNHDQDTVVDTLRIRVELGYHELMGRDEAFRRTVEWERAHPPEKIDPASFDYAAEDAVLAEFSGREA